MSNFAGKRVLVTGADGFIGSHLVEKLLELGAKVRAFVMYNSFNSWGWLDQSPKAQTHEIEIFAGDVRDPYRVKEACLDCEIVYHLAALIGIPYSYHSPDTYIDTNIKGTLNILQAAKELAINRVIHTSTSEVYGSAQYVPIDENHPLQAQSPYSASKIGADQMALAFYRSFATPVTIVRPFNTYGPRQSARAVIPTIITQIAAGQKEIKIGALKPTRDFSFVDDVVQGFIAASQAQKAIGEVINLGSGFEISIEETISLIAETMGKKVEIVQDKARLRPEKSEVERLFANNTKAKKLLSWAPKFAGREGFQKGLQITIEWFCQPANIARYKQNQYNI